MGPIGIQELLILAVVAVVVLLPMIFYLLTLQRALERCSAAARTLTPSHVWFMLIPLFSLIWHFIVVIRIGDSLANEFRLRGLPMPPEPPGKTLGIVMCSLFVASLIPLLGILLMLGGVGFWIAYWIKIADYSRTLATASSNVLPYQH